MSLDHGGLNTGRHHWIPVKVAAARGQYFHCAYVLRCTQGYIVARL